MLITKALALAWRLCMAGLMEKPFANPASATTDTELGPRYTRGLCYIRYRKRKDPGPLSNEVDVMAAGRHRLWHHPDLSDMLRGISDASSFIPGS